VKLRSFALINESSLERYGGTGGTRAALLSSLAEE